MKKIITILLLWACLPSLSIAQCATSSAPTNNCSFGDQINAFALNSISATGNSGCGASGYNSFSSPVWTLQIGNTYSWTATVGSGLYTGGVGIWIDLNNDGSYATTEFIASSGAALSHASTLNIPFSSAVGTNLRMRVRSAYSSAVTSGQACTNAIGFGYGETEDYYVYLVCPSSTPSVTIAASSTVVCSGNSVTLTASGLSTYTWSGGVTNGIAFFPSLSATYNVTAGINPGCPTNTVTASRTISVNTTPTITGISSGSVCPGVSFVMTPGGANTYSYAGGSGTLTGASATVSPIVTTAYSVSGTASNGCVSSLASAGYATVTTLASPTLILSASAASICPGVSSSITVSGANTYTWVSPASNATQVSVNPTVTSIYTVSGTGTNVCNGVKTITLTVYPTPTITVNSGTICAGKTFTMIPSGASTFTYSSGSNTVIPVGPLDTYSVSGTSSNGCLSSTSAVASVTSIALPVVSVNSGSICNGAFFAISPSGATTYTFLNGTSPVYPTVTTTYSVIGSSSIGCISLPAVSTVTVFNLPTLVVVANPSNMAVCVNSPISFTVSGANTYNWNNTSAGMIFSTTPSASSSYFVIGTDANGCANVATLSVTVNPLPPLAFSSSNTFVCLGNSLTLTTSGADTYTWTQGITSTNVAVSPLISTIYGATGSNTLGCSKTLTLAVSVNTIIMTLTSNTTICEGNVISLSASGPDSFTWTPANGPFGSITVTPAITTTYSLNAKDNKNCLHSGAVTVSVNPNPVVNAATSNSQICVGESVTLTATGANTYTWSLTSSTNNIGSTIVVTPVNNNITINYVVTGASTDGCMHMDTVAVRIDKCTGLTNLNNITPGISIYPNPNTGEFTVELNNGSNKIIEVSDVTGRLVLSSESKEDKTLVNLNDFASGVYYVKILSNKNVEVLRIIKQ